MAVATIRSSAVGKTGTVTVTHTASPPPAGTALATAAQSIGTNSSASFPISWPGGSGAYLEWCTRFHWDRARGIGWLMCKTAGTTQPHLLFRYEEATNTWTLPFNAFAQMGGGSGSGHGNDNSALDQATGDFYFLALYAERVVKWNGAGWTNATGNMMGPGFSSNETGPNGLEWHPNLYGPGDGGLITSYGASSNTRMTAWRKSDGPDAAFTAIYNLPSSARYSQGVYVEDLDAVFYTCGVGSRACYMVTPGPVVTRIQDTPVAVTAWTDPADKTQMNRLFETPTGTAAIFEYGGAGRIWQYVHSSQSWALQTSTHPMSLGGSNPDAWPAAFIKNRGVYWALRQVSGGASPPNSLLYRPPGTL